MEQYFNYQFPEIKTKNLAIKLSVTTEKKLAKSAHPWIYSHSLEKQPKEGNAGDVAVIFRNRDDRIFGIGLYDPDSPILIKMLHYHGAAKINRDFFRTKIQKAVKQRERIPETNTNAYRLVYGENDGLPGLIADLYQRVLVVKLYSPIWFPYLKIVLEELIDASGCSVVVLRLNRELQESEHYGLKDGMVIFGKLAKEEVRFDEYGVHFQANVIKGHKTGFFLDHRENRHKVGLLAKGKTMLDVFSYAGGFAVHALACGAKEVTSLDISNQALALARKNADLNPHSGTLKTIQGDAFKALEEMVSRKKKYDLVVIDPPSFAKSKREIRLAEKKYAELALLGRRLLRSNGILVLASCSSRVPADDFFHIVENVLGLSNYEFELIERTGHAPDHPVNFPEGAYLKCGYYQKIG